MYMGQEENAYLNYSIDDLGSLVDRYNAAVQRKRDLGIQTNFLITDVTVIEPFGGVGDYALRIDYATGQSYRMQFGDFINDVAAAELSAQMVEENLSRPGAIESYVVQDFIPLPPMTEAPVITPLPGPIYAAPTSVPSASTMPEPVIPNVGLPDLPNSGTISELPAGLPAPSGVFGMSWPVLALIGAGIYILARR